jgi:hypothetical protein
MFAQGDEDDHAADRKGHYGGECSDQHEGGVEVKDIGEYGSDGEGDAQGVEPKRAANGRRSSGQRRAGTQSKLEEQCGHADGGDHDQSHRTEERSTAGIEDDQRESSEQQAGGYEGGAARLGMRAGVGRVFRHGVPSKDLYRALEEVTNRRVRGRVKSF